MHFVKRLEGRSVNNMLPVWNQSWLAVLLSPIIKRATLFRVHLYAAWILVNSFFISTSELGKEKIPTVTTQYFSQIGNTAHSAKCVKTDETKGRRPSVAAAARRRPPGHVCRPIPKGLQGSASPHDI